MHARRCFSVLLLLLGLSLPAVAPADDASSKADTAITQRVEAALRERRLLLPRGIEIDTQAGVVQLSGFVDSEELQEQALETARNVPGVASVRNDLVLRETKPTPGAALDDTIVAAKVRQELKDNSVVAANDIQVEVSAGLVQLSGFVPTVEEKTRAGDIASGVKGVRDVRNDIALER